MKNKLILGLSTLALSTSLHAGNYKLCNKVINPYSNFSQGANGSPYGGGFASGIGIGLAPYTIEDNGKIKPAKGVKEYKHDKKNHQEIITYEVAIFPYELEPGEQPDYSQMQPVMKEQKVIIQRNEKGEIKQITNDFNVKQSDLDKHNKMMKKWYEYTYSDKYKEQMKKMQEQWGLEDFQTPIMMPIKSDIHLSVVDGKCRVDRSTMTQSLTIQNYVKT